MNDLNTFKYFLKRGCIPHKQGIDGSQLVALISLCVVSLFSLSFSPPSLSLYIVLLLSILLSLPFSPSMFLSLLLLHPPSLRFILFSSPWKFFQPGPLLASLSPCCLPAYLLFMYSFPVCLPSFFVQMIFFKLVCSSKSNKILNISI